MNQDAPRLSLLVSGSTWLAEGVLGLRLTDPSDSPLPAWGPGAHIDLLLPSGTVRSYSLCGDPDDTCAYHVAVLREERGRGGSAEIHDTQLVGRTIEVRGPRNGFPLESAPAYLFLAGGIGITPLLTMARAAHAPWSLVYLGRRRSTMAFVEELGGLPGKVDIVARDQRDRLDLSALLDTVDPGTAVYCCGPAGLIADIEQLGAARGLTVRVEHFGRPELRSPTTAVAYPHAASSVHETELDDDDFDPEGSFDVELAQTGVTLHIAPGESILEKARDVRQGLAFSCEEGYCGSCEVAVLAGRPDHRDTVLTEDEKLDGDTMMICVGRSRGPRLILDL